MSSDNHIQLKTSESWVSSLQIAVKQSNISNALKQIHFVLLDIVLWGGGVQINSYIIKSAVRLPVDSQLPQSKSFDFGLGNQFYILLCNKDVDTQQHHCMFSTLQMVEVLLADVLRADSVWHCKRFP